ncbi:MAG: hypothetical protein ABI234_18260 [Ktedonobacteraceae bacterium]
MGRWDLSLKAILRESPQDFVTLLVPDARYIRMRDGQFITRELPEGLFPMREMRSDCLIEAEVDGKLFLILVEFQSTKDEDMGQRLLGYSFEARRAYGMPVLACVIYPRHVYEPPLSYGWAVPRRGVQVTARYDSIELDEMPLAELEQTGLIGLAPLWVCTKGGTTREVLERAITLLEETHKPEGLAVLRLLALLVLEHDATMVAWIEWRFAHMHDYLLENSPMYKELVAEGEVKGFEKGEMKGFEKGEMKGREEMRKQVEQERQRVLVAQAIFRETVVTAVARDFPQLAKLAKKQVSLVENLERLQRLILDVTITRDATQMAALLTALDDDESTS